MDSGSFKEETGEYMPSPFRRCGCPNGRYFCSHMVAFLSILSNMEELGLLLKLLPPCVKNVQGPPEEDNNILLIHQ